MADGSLEGRAIAVRVQWDQTQADAHKVQDEANRDSASLEGADAVFKVGTRIWKEDMGPIPPRNADHVRYVFLFSFPTE